MLDACYAGSFDAKKKRKTRGLPSRPTRWLVTMVND